MGGSEHASDRGSGGAGRTIRVSSPTNVPLGRGGGHAAAVVRPRCSGASLNESSLG